MQKRQTITNAVPINVYPPHFPPLIPNPFLKILESKYSDIRPQIVDFRNNMAFVAHEL